MTTLAIKQNIFLAILKRELHIGSLNLVEILTPTVFTLVITTLFAFALGASAQNLVSFGPGVIWTAILLAMIISVENMFTTDYEDGTLEQLYISPNYLTVLILAKITARWLWGIIPLIFISPLLALMFNLPINVYPVFLLSLFLATPSLYLIGSFGAALLVGQKRGSALVALLVLPLSIPILIFASGLIYLAINQLAIEGAILFLSAILVISLTLIPFAVSTVIFSNGSEG